MTTAIVANGVVVRRRFTRWGARRCAQRMSRRTGIAHYALASTGEVLR